MTASMPKGIGVHVSAVRALARDVLELELRRADGSPLPGASPGAHIDVTLGNGLVRAYSLTNADAQPTLDAYRIAVGLDARASRGGSRWIHEQLRLNSVIRISAPRNLFAIDADHRRLLLVAGGIGITPIFAMARWAAANCVPWRLAYACRSESRAAFVEELRALDESRVHFHFDDRHGGGGLDVQALVAGAANDEAIYCCGPQSLMDAVRRATAACPMARVRFESFVPAPETDTADHAFVLRLLRSGLSTQVAAHETVLAAMERLHIDHPFSCRQGLCGTCEVRLVSGEADHRDAVLSEADRRAGQRFMPCVSRCRGDVLEIEA